jgi:hypothetical protein
LGDLPGAPFVRRPLGDLEQAVKTGTTPFDRSFGKRFFDYLAGNPGDSAIFNHSFWNAPRYSGELPK